MTISTRNLLIIVIILFSVIIILLMFQQGCKKTSKSPVTIEKPDTLHSINKAGDSVTSLKGHDIDFSIIEKRVIDSVAKVYSTKQKRLQELVIAQTRTITALQATGSIERDYEPIDTNHSDCPPEIAWMRQKFTNNYYTADVQIGDSSFMNLLRYDTITTLWKHIKQGSIFNRKHFIQFDISLADPDTRITGLLAYKVPKKKPKKWGIGASVGAMYYDGKARPYAGIGLNYNFIRF